jgi:hypothetical protein
MFTDAKGYLITEMVWEDCSDGEAPSDPPAAIKQTQQPAMPAAASKPKNSSGKAAAAAGAPGQKSMMSFFGKK